MILKLDLDGRRIHWDRIRAVKEIFKLDIDFDKSKILKTHKGFHLKLYLNNIEFKDEDQCFLQLASGDDYKRSCLNWRRIRFGEQWQKENWNVLFNQKFHVDIKGNRKLVSEEKEMNNNILRRMLG